MAGGVQRAKLATSIAADPSERGAREENVMPYVQANGIHIYYEDHGSGAPMLLIHGGCSDATFWGSAVDELGRLGASLPTTGAAAAEPSGRSPTSRPVPASKRLMPLACSRRSMRYPPS
jgi:hypothetical protein